MLQSVQSPGLNAIKKPHGRYEKSISARKPTILRDPRQVVKKVSEWLQFESCEDPQTLLPGSVILCLKNSKLFNEILMNYFLIP